MDTRASLGEKLPDRARWAERREQLDLGIPEGERLDGRAIGHLGRMWLEPEDVAVEAERCLEIGNCYTDVRNAGAVSHRLSSEWNADRSSHTGWATADLTQLENNGNGRNEYLDGARERRLLCERDRAG